jgi:hypothetical protein
MFRAITGGDERCLAALVTAERQLVLVAFAAWLCGRTAFPGGDAGFGAGPAIGVVTGAFVSRLPAGVSPLLLAIVSSSRAVTPGSFGLAQDIGPPGAERDEGGNRTGKRGSPRP